MSKQIYIMYILHKQTEQPTHSHALPDYNLELLLVQGRQLLGKKRKEKKEKERKGNNKVKQKIKKYKM